MNQTDTESLPAADLEMLLREFERPLLRYAWRLTRGVENAQDVVQEVFLRYHTDPPGDRDARRIGAWLYRVTHNLCIDLIRKESRMRAHAQTLEPPEAAPPEAARLLEAEDTRTQLNRLLDHLTENQRTVIVLKVQESKSYREISEITGLSVSNVGFLIHQAMKNLSALARQQGVL